jgi:hypothetical protein
MDKHERIVGAMELALHGDREAGRRFYEGLFEGPLYAVPRHQLPDSVDYPNDLVHLLGLKSGDRVIVPAFTDPTLATSWGGHAIVTKEMIPSLLFQAVPDGWWLCINPGAEVEKEFSPWELDLLRRGPASIPELIDDLFATRVVEVLETEPLGEGEAESLKQALIEEASRDVAVRALYLLRERGRDIDEQESSSILIGIAIAHESARDHEAIVERYSRIADLQQIGSERARVFGGVEDRENLVLKMFEGVAPLWERAEHGGLSERVVRWVQSTLRRFA